MAYDADSLRLQRLLARLTLIGTLLVFVVISASAYLRLSQSGLGCTDWPQCYGRIGPAPSAELPLRLIVRVAHRIAAMIVTVLNLLILYLCWTRKPISWPARFAGIALIALTVFLTILGRATPEAQLPAITLGNLLGGFAMLALLWQLYLHARPSPQIGTAARFSYWLRIGVIIAIVQIVLGALVSAHYAALSCTTFPDCGGQWWPQALSLADINPWRGYRFAPDGTVLASASMQTLHMLHRYGALVTLCYFIGCAVALLLTRHELRTGLILLAAALLPAVLGMSAVRWHPPIGIVLAHNAAGALLLLVALHAARRHARA